MLYDTHVKQMAKTSTVDFMKARKPLVDRLNEKHID